jgi:CRISPR/Cas system-associated endonuclease Cas1
LAAGESWKKIYNKFKPKCSFSCWYGATRNLVPPGPLRFDPKTGTLEVDAWGAFVTLKAGLLNIASDGETFVLKPGHKVASVHLRYPASLSTPALYDLTIQGIGLVVWQGQEAISMFTHEAVTDKRSAAMKMREQALAVAIDPQSRFGLAREIVLEKLTRFGAAAHHLARTRMARTIQSVMLVEAHATKEVWRQLGIARQRPVAGAAIGAAIRQRARKRKIVSAQKAADPVNASINYCNSVAADVLLRELVAAGFDPATGYLHRKRPMPLVYDCLELMRGKIALTVHKFVRGADHAGCFKIAGDEVILSPAARRDLARLAHQADAREAVAWLAGQIDKATHHNEPGTLIDGTTARRITAIR